MKLQVDITEIEAVLITARSLEAVLDVWLYVAEEKDADLINACSNLINNIMVELEQISKKAEEQKQTPTSRA
ncbi:TPA: hypothetical protein IGZ65_003921 [Escherichia coli]|nr:hypothetical protein [Escherichia coli]